MMNLGFSDPNYGGMPDDNGIYGGIPDPYGGMPDDNGQYGESPAAGAPKKKGKWKGKLKGALGAAGAMGTGPDVTQGMPATQAFAMTRPGLLMR